MVQYKLPLNHLAKIIASEVDIDPSGEVGNSNRVRSGFSKRSIEDIGNIVIRLPNSQKKVFLREKRATKNTQIDDDKDKINNVSNLKPI